MAIKSKLNVWLAFLIWAVSLVLIVLLTDKQLAHLSINQYHTPFFDVFFKYATFLGDGLIVGLIIIMLLLFSYRWGLVALISFGSSAIITQLLKRLVFDSHTRPITYFKDLYDFHLIDGVQMHTLYSFPSGHSAAAFSIFTVLAILSQSRQTQIFSMLVAMIAAFSRVYLSQHFLEDILVGSFIGYSCAISADKVLGFKKWAETGLLNFLKKFH